MYNPDEDLLQEIQSSDSDEDVSTSARSRSQPHDIKELVHGKLSQLHHEIISDDDGDDMTSPIGSPPAEISALGGRNKFLQLKRKLEEDQAKSQSIQPIQVTDVQTLLENLQKERDPNKSLASKIEANPKFLELYQQVKDRDHKILDLETKLMEQSRIIVDLEDNLGQREKALNSKNEAFSVVQQKFEAELRLKKEELEKSQRLLFEMERNLGKVQDQWKEDKDRLNTELKKQTDKYEKLESDFKSLETCRFQFTTEIAELKEQLVRLQSENESLRSENDSLKLSSNETESLHLELKSLREEFQQLQAGAEEKIGNMEKFAREQQEMEQLKNKLELDLEILDRQRENYEEDLRKLNQDRENYEAELNQFKEEKSTFGEENEALTEEKIAVSRERELLESEKEALASEKELFETEKLQVIHGREEDSGAKDQKIQELTEQLNKAKENIKKLKVQFQNKLKALREEKKDAVPADDNQLADLQAKVTSLENKVTELEEEKGNLLLRLVDFDEHSDLNEAKENLTTLKDTLAHDRLALEMDQEALKEEQASLSQQRESLTAEIQKFDLDRQQFDSHKEKLAHDQERLSKELESFRFEQETLLAARLDLDERENNLKIQLDSLLKDQEALRNEQDAVNFEREALINQRRVIEEELGAVEAQKAALVAEKEQLTDEKEVLRTDKQGLAMERETLQAEIEQQQQDLQASMTSSTVGSATGSEQELSQKVKELEGELERARNNVKKLKVQFQAKLKQIKQETKGETSTAETAELQEKIQVLENKLAELEEEKGNLLLRVVDFEEIQAAHDAMMVRVHSMEQTILANEEKIKFLERRQQYQEVPLDLEEPVTAMQFTSNLSTPHSILTTDEPDSSNQIVALNQEIEILEHSLRDRSEQVKSLEGQIKSLEEQVKSLEEQIEFNREDFTSAVADFDQLINKRNQEHAEATSALQNDLEKLKGENESLQAELSQLKDSNETAKVEKVGEAFDVENQQPESSASEDVADLKVQLKNLITENQKLRSELMEKKAHLKQSQNEMECFREFTDWNQPNLQQLSKTVEERTQELEEMTEEKYVEVLRLTAENAELNRLLDETKTKLSIKTEEVTAAKNELIKTTATLDQVVKSLADSEKTIAEKTLEFMDLTEAKERMRVILDAANDQIQSMAHLNTQLELQVQQLLAQESNQNSSTEELQSLRAEMTCLAEQEETLRAEHELLRAHEEALQVQIYQLQSLRDSLNVEISQLRTQEDSLRAELTQSKDKEQALCAEINQLEEQEATLQNELAVLRTQDEARKSEINVLKEQLLEKDDESESVVVELQDLRNRVDQLTLELENERAALQPLQEEISALKTQLVEKDEELDFTNDQVVALSMKANQAETLAKSLEEAQEALTHVQSEALELRNALDAHAHHTPNFEKTAQELSQMNQQLLEKSQELSQKNQELEVIRSDLTFAQAQISSLQLELAQAQELVRLQHEQTQINSQRALEEQRSAFETQINDLTQKLSFLEDSLRQKEQEFQDLSQIKEADVFEFKRQKEDEFLMLAQAKDSVASQLRERDGTIEKLNSQLAEVNALLEGASVNLKSKETELEFTREEMNKLTEALNSVQKEVLNDVQEKEDSLQVQVSELTNLINDKDAEIQKIMSDYDEYYNQARIELENKTKQLEALEQALFERNETVAKLEESLRELRERHQADVFQAIEKHNEEEEALLSKMATLTSENVQFKSQIESLQAELTALRVSSQEAIPTPSRSSFFQQQADPSSFFDNLASVPLETSEDTSLRAELEEKSRQIYEQEVEITNLQITVDDLKGQINEVAALRAELDIFQYQNTQLKEEVESLRREISALQTERVRKLEQFIDMEAISGPRSLSPAQPTPPAGGLVVEEPMVRAAAYVTTDSELPSADVLKEKDAQIASLNTEIRELKVKSGRAIQKLRQLTNKYEELSKAHEALKTKSEFSLESTFEGELTEQLKKKDADIEEKTKLIQEIQAERTRLQSQLEVFERAHEKLTEGKENQDRMLETLTGQKRQLEQEIQGLRWKLAEQEEGDPSLVSLNAAPTAPAPPSQEVQDLLQEMNSLRTQNATLSQEIDTLQQEIEYQRDVVASLQQQLEQASQFNTLAHQVPADMPQQEPASLQQQVIVPTDVPQQKIEELTSEEVVERAILEKKIELLQDKIKEVEDNETRYFEDVQKWKMHAQMLDMENLTNQELISELTRRVNSTERDNLKSKILQEEVNRLILALDEKDNVKCEQITSEILKLQEEKATLEYQLRVSGMQPPPLNVAIPEGDNSIAIRHQLAELEQRNIGLEIDLRREQNARRIVQEQLFFKQASRNQNHRLGALVGSPFRSTSPAHSSRSSPMPSPTFGSLFSTPPPGRHSPRPTPDSSPQKPQS